MFPGAPDELFEMMFKFAEKYSLFSPKQIDTSPQAFLSIKQAMKKYNAKRSLFYRLSSDRKVSTRKIGKEIQFCQKELDEYFNQSIRPSEALIAESLKDNLFQMRSKKGKRSG